VTTLTSTRVYCGHSRFLPDQRRLFIWDLSGVQLNIYVGRLHHATAAAESTSNRVTISCNCKAVYTSRCCSKKNQVQYSVYCHADEQDCGNLSPLINCIGKLNPGSRASWDSCQTECKTTQCKKENQCNSWRTKYRKSDKGTACAGAGGRIN